MQNVELIDFEKNLFLPLPPPKGDKLRLGSTPKIG